MARISAKYRVEYVVLLMTAMVVRALPRQAAIKLGRILGRWAMSFLPGRYRLAKDNMTKAFPEFSEAEIKVHLRKSFEHIGISGVEMLRLDMFIPGSRDIRDYFLIEDLSPLYAALEMDRGVILLTGHLGFWEVGLFLLPELGIPFDVVAKPLKNPLTDRYFEKIRKTYGAEVLESRKGARRIVKSLQEKHVVAILLDQHISPPGSVAVDFFGRKAYTTTAITSLAMKYQIPVVPVFCLRRPDNRYKVWAEQLIILDTDGDNAVAANTQLLTNKIEEAIRKDVSQWFWMHKRWRVKR